MSRNINFNEARLSAFMVIAFHSSLECFFALRSLKGVLLCFPLKSFIVLAFMFKFIIQIKLFSVCGVKYNQGTFFPYRYPIVLHHLLKRLSFTELFAPLLKIS